MKKIPYEKLTRDSENETIYFPNADPEDNLGKRNKLGGNPDFIQNIENPVCKKCNKQMVFYAQIDSINEKFSIDDGGMIYVFYCFECGEVYAFSQSY